MNEGRESEQSSPRTCVEAISPIEPLPYRVTAIDAREEGLGWAATDAGLILHTRDGGVTWHKQNRNSDCALWGIRFLDATNGWAVGAHHPEGVNVDLGCAIARSWPEGGKGVLLSTRDAGLSWHERRLPDDDYCFNDVHFTDSGRGWVVGDCGFIAHTEDGGRTWRSMTKERTADHFACHFFRDSSGIIAGTRPDCSYPYLGDVTDPQTRSSMDEVVSEGFVIRTDDGGESWVRVHSVLGGTCNAMAFIDAERGWVVGDDGLILASCDGGSTWEAQTSGTPESLTSVSFLDRYRGWVVGKNGVILRTADGGATWKVEATADGRHPHSLCATRTGECWMGSQGALLRLKAVEEYGGPDDAGVVIRQASVRDLRAIQRLFFESGIAEDLACTPYPFEDRWSTSLHTRREADIPGNYGLIAEVGGVVAGYLGMQGETGYRRRGVLRVALGVARDFRRQGVGSELLTHALEVIDDWLPIMRVEALIYEDCATGAAFLAKHAFKTDGVLPSYACRGGELMNVRVMSRIS